MACPLGEILHGHIKDFARVEKTFQIGTKWAMPRRDRREHYRVCVFVVHTLAQLCREVADSRLRNQQLLCGQDNGEGRLHLSYFMCHVNLPPIIFTK